LRATERGGGTGDAARLNTSGNRRAAAAQKSRPRDAGINLGSAIGLRAV
jgi:hypothetical protein